MPVTEDFYPSLQVKTIFKSLYYYALLLTSAVKWNKADRLSGGFSARN
jgi:hypothetical protein